MSSSSSRDSSDDETPRPADFGDYDFFDSDTNKDAAAKEKSKTKSHGTSPQDVLHGSKPSEQPQKPRFVVRNNRQQQKTYVSSSTIEMKSTLNTKEPRPEIKVPLTVHMPQQKEESDSNSSDSVFDVSPLSTPNATPRPSSSAQRNGRKQEALPKISAGGDSTASESPQSKMGVSKRPHAHIRNGEALSIEDLLYSSDSSGPDSSDERAERLQKKKAVHRKRRSKYEDVQHRTEASSRMHRRRLLDAAAENSMDLSQLLEVVLEMEQDKKARRNFAGGTAGRNILPPPIKASHKKNMSFTNEQVHNIDRENQRLLRRLAQLNTRQRPSSASSVRSSASSCRSTASTKRSGRRPMTAGSTQYGTAQSRGPRTYHSATNRLRDQQRIERENLALLKRLQTTKSSSALRRDNLLRDYERQTGRILDTKPPARRRQKPAYARYADYETDSINQNRHRGKPAWQD